MHSLAEVHKNDAPPLILVLWKKYIFSLHNPVEITIYFLSVFRVQIITQVLAYVMQEGQ